MLKNQESCVINGGKTSQYFKLERGTRQGDPISAYLFIIVLEVIFLNIIQNSHIKGIELFDKEFIYTAYADDTVFKSLAFSKIIHLALVKAIPNTTVEELNKIQQNFIWNNSKPKIKTCTLSGSYLDSGLKNVNIKAKIISLQCSWIKRLYSIITRIIGRLSHLVSLINI